MCEMYGCIYNEDGRCAYDEAPVKMECAKACSDPYDDDPSDYEN